MSPRGSRGRRGPSGFVIADKPEGPTSFEVMRQVARKLGGGKAGHAGTLDPAASGVLVVLLGEATKLSRWVVAHDKVYRAVIRFGIATDTLDREGAVVARADVPPGALTPARVEEVLPRFVGVTSQVPPAYSAIKVGGRSLMSRARAGEAVDPAPREVVCHSLALVSAGDDEVVLDVHCGKGYYVRSLARDVGEALGLPSHLAALRRLRSGAFDIADAVPVDAIDKTAVRPLVDAAYDVPKVTVTAEEAALVRNGRPIAAAPGLGPRAILLAPDGAPLAMVERDADERWAVERGFQSM